MPFNKEAIKQAGASPDAFSQLALQLAFWRLLGTQPPVYETASTRRFHNGRTETIRSATIEVSLWRVVSMSERPGFAACSVVDDGATVVAVACSVGLLLLFLWSCHCFRRCGVSIAAVVAPAVLGCCCCFCGRVIAFTFGVSFAAVAVHARVAAVAIVVPVVAAVAHAVVVDIPVAACVTRWRVWRAIVCSCRTAP